MSLIKDIKFILTSNGIHYPIYLSFMPDVDKPVVFALYQTGGRGKNKGNGIEEPTFQLLVKADDYEEMMQAVSQIEDVLHEVDETTIGSEVYMTFFQDSNPIDLGKDGAGRYTLSVNFRCFVHSIK